MTPRHFLTGAELTAGELDALLGRAIELKAAPLQSRALDGRSVALIFEKPSTRTRISFEVGIGELGGHAVVLREGAMQLSRGGGERGVGGGEACRDGALVLSPSVGWIGGRPGRREPVAELTEHASVPVV